MKNNDRIPARCSLENLKYPFMVLKSIDSKIID
jgi:hypothetical protein